MAGKSIALRHGLENTTPKGLTPMARVPPRMALQNIEVTTNWQCFVIYLSQCTLCTCMAVFCILQAVFRSPFEGLVGAVIKVIWLRAPRSFVGRSMMPCS
jgi:hypothetical protein